MSMTPTEIQGYFEAIVTETARVIVGQKEVVEGTLLALFSHGHVLIEGPPGMGKTLIAITLARVLGSDSRRVQCTPDLMPGDLVGHSIFDMKQQQFVYRKGPVFTNILLADEVNRATPKTQAAMLECLQERQVTVDGTTYPISPPFVTMATQNPLEYEGTYPLPEAQVDRFLFKLMADYPTLEEETEILARYESGMNLFDLDSVGVKAVVSRDIINGIIAGCAKVRVEKSVLSYISTLVTRTRDWPRIAIGASPRASVSILMAARAAAAVAGRDYVTPDDVRKVALPALRHRIRLVSEAVIHGITADSILEKLMESVEVPRG